MVRRLLLSKIAEREGGVVFDHCIVTFKVCHTKLGLKGCNRKACERRYLKTRKMMKKILYVAIALSAAACSARNDLQETFENVVEAGSDMALDSLQHRADKELQGHTGVDSLAARFRSADTLDVKREVRRELIERLSN